MKSLALTLVALLALCDVVNAASTIVVGQHLLQPNTPNQTIDIYVTGDDRALGVVFAMEVGPSTCGCGFPTPIITDVDLTGPGTIFSSNNTGNQVTIPAPGNQVLYGTTTQAGTVLTNGLLARITFDTTGVPAWGNYPLILSFVDDWGIGTDWAMEGFGPTIVDGSIGGLCPEPGSAALALMAAGGWAAMTFRKRRSRRKAAC